MVQVRTGQYSLIDIGKLRRGKTILIRATSADVGQTVKLMIKRSVEYTGAGIRNDSVELRYWPSPYFLELLNFFLDSAAQMVMTPISGLES